MKNLQVCAFDGTFYLTLLGIVVLSVTSDMFNVYVPTPTDGVGGTKFLEQGKIGFGSDEAEKVIIVHGPCPQSANKNRDNEDITCPLVFTI
ncbi:hypothetical protein TNCT_482981 [Trichonephila clavata]|uniref:Uncharacterized protein n=1 Tax=Trichonephila clavata TaxID=2740835 RepID=A0A8X6EXA1_TRICU|nr:hypothetical protein TNCT_482981 [Trichonephila clavata]